MDVVHEECDRVTVVLRDLFPFLLPSRHEFVIELDEQQRLVLHIGEQVVFADETEHIGATKTEEKWKSFSRLAVERIPRC